MADAGSGGAVPPDRPGEAETASATGRGRKLIAMMAGLVALAAVVFAFAGRGRTPPYLPPDIVHRAALGSPRPANVCLNCHSRSNPAPGAPPQSAGHTGRQDCQSCHEIGPAAGS